MNYSIEVRFHPAESGYICEGAIHPEPSEGGVIVPATFELNVRRAPRYACATCLPQAVENATQHLREAQRRLDERVKAAGLHSSADGKVYNGEGYRIPNPS